MKTKQCQACQNTLSIQNLVKIARNKEISNTIIHESPGHLAESSRTCESCLYLVKAFVSQGQQSGLQIANDAKKDDLIQEFLTIISDIKWAQVRIECVNQNLMISSDREDAEPRLRLGGDKDACDIVSIEVVFSALTHGNAGYSWALYLDACSDSPAALNGDIGGRPLLRNSGTDDAFALVQDWERECSKSHTKCQVTIAGQRINDSRQIKLPSRVIHLRGSKDNIKPHVLATQGKMGAYTALSHRWGDMELLALQKHNITERLLDISWDSLPKTFRDAMTVTKSIGIDYIWIDSLCIIQNDQVDWINESARMGEIYESAWMTIVASNAKDANEGLFIDRPELYPSLELPYYDSNGDEQGSCFMDFSREYLSEDGDCREQGPLFKRAWATQEWLLSRRAVYYAKDRMIWLCKTLQTSERGFVGEGLRERDGSNIDWTELIEYHSARDLTYETDRLMSLSGISREVAKTRPDDEYNWGVWKSEIHRNLVWQRSRRAIGIKSDNPLNAPSWSWVSVLGPVNFWKGYYDPSYEIKIEISDKVITLHDAYVVELPTLEAFKEIEETWWFKLDMGNIDIASNWIPVFSVLLTRTNYIMVMPVTHEPETCFRRIGCGIFFDSIAGSYSNLSVSWPKRTIRVV